MSQLYDQEYGPEAVGDGPLYMVDDESSREHIDEFLEEEGYDELELDHLDEVLDDPEQYVEELEDVEASQYLEVDEEEDVLVAYRLASGEDEGGEYMDIAVQVVDLHDGLFGFTNTESDHVNVNRNLYSSEREETEQHEKEHQRNPHLTELHIRYRNGDIDPENSLSMARYNNDDPHRSLAFDPTMIEADGYDAI